MKIQEEDIINNESYEDPDNSYQPEHTFLIRQPRLTDARNIWHLVKESGVLDPNSVYCYLLLCEHFRETCRVAEQDGKLAGFVTAYIPPNIDNILFVWQIGIVMEFRGQGIARKLILDLLSANTGKGINTLLATVAPSNTVSMALFHSIARHLQTHIRQQEFFSAAMFPGMQHEQENLVTIGPFNL
jgi:L-2,4-diaminobutyric acid acetyltransferase